ncbi:MAG: histidine phosphatase family protein [Planctomycetota bacterium]
MTEATSNQGEYRRIVCSQLRNRHFLLRHGQSEANALGRIASSPGIAVAQFGLTEKGRDQIAVSIDQHRNQLAGVDQVFCSDFRRTRETAEIAAVLLDATVNESILLRERSFGMFDGQSDQKYQVAWSADEEDATHRKWDVESVASVADRMCGFVRELDQSGDGNTYLIVSHGDPLQILLTSALGRDLRQHRQIEPLATAELRPLC